MNSNEDNDVIARASWELMKNARVSGVYGKNGELDTKDGNGNVTGGGAHYQDFALPAVGDGAAILFVGKKTDKTLLAVGRLSHIGNEPVGPSVRINSLTTSVTFAVDALISGVVGEKLTSLPTSSFMTSFGATVSPHSAINETNTRGNGQGFKEDFQLGDIGVGFPLFKLREDGYLTYAKYEFFTVSGTSLSNYGIIQAGLGNYEKRQPRYPTQGGGFQYFSVILDNTTQISAVSNEAGNIGSTFENPVLVTFNPATTEKGSICAFVFEVPVCPLSMPRNGKPDPGIWYMRPSYDSYWWDLDDGRGAGGAVLIGYGDVKEVDDFRIRVVKPPDKYLYPNSNRAFNITGLVVELQSDSPGHTHIEWINNADLTFRISNPIAPGNDVDPLVYGIVYVEVSYTLNGKIHTDFFVIVADDPGGTYAAPIPLSHYFVVDDYMTNVVDIQSRLFSRISSAAKGGSNTFVIIANRNFDLYGLELNSVREPFVIIVVAGKAGGDDGDDPDGVDYDPALNHEDGIGHRVIGRADQNGAYSDQPRYQGAFRVYSRSSTAFYFGTWPFNTPLRSFDGRESGTNTPSDATHLRTYSYREAITVTGMPAGSSPGNGTYYVHKSYPYIINAAGPYQDVLNTVPAYTAEPAARDPTGPATGTGTATGHKFFIWGSFGGTVYNVQVGNDIKVKNRKWFY